MVAVPALAFPVASTVVSRNDHPARKDGLSIEREVLEAKRIATVSGMAPNTFSAGS